jgi:type IV fimbrial biogenesis protein FimT
MFLRHNRFGYSNGRGFSLVELMVSLAILSILAGLAAPSFGDSIKRYRINAIREDLGASVQLARAEAIRRGLPIVLIRELSCGVALVDSDDWSCGWRMVQDTDADGTISTAERAVILQTTTVPAGYRVNHPNLGNSVAFGIWGQATVAQQRFVIAPPEGSSDTSTAAMCLSSGGRITTSKKDATCVTS